VSDRSDWRTSFAPSALAALLMLASPGARAGAVTVSGGDTVVFTFDFSVLSSQQPPYPAVRVDTGIDLGTVDDHDWCRYTLYRDGHAAGPDSSVVSCGILTFEAGTEDSGWLDGLLSIAITVLDGSVTLDPHASAFTAIGPDGQPLTPRLSPLVRVVHEPAASWLALIAGCAMWLRRRPSSARGLVPTATG
jgi:hypothetical protein